ncbi:hypothetical protein Tco_1156059 [Tanacetum coccineum]
MESNDGAIPCESNLFQRTCKYEDFDGYTSDDLILILEILSRRCLLKIIYLVSHRSERPPSRILEDQAKMEMETPRSSGVNSPPNAHT